MNTPLRKLTAVVSLTCASLLAASLSEAATLYSDNFEGYTLGSYPFPATPLPGWNATPSGSGLTPSIVTPVNASGNALEMNSPSGGVVGWAMVSTPILAGSSTDWSVQGSARVMDTSYGAGGLFLSSSSDGTSGDWLWLGIEGGWGVFSPNVTWARPWAQWNLGGVSGGGTLFAPVVNDNGAIRMYTTTENPALLTASRTGGSSDISFVIDSPVDAQRIATLSFSGAQATALNNLQYVGFANYYDVWQYDNLVVTGVPEPSSAALAGLGLLGLIAARRRQRSAAR